MLNVRRIVASLLSAVLTLTLLSAPSALAEDSPQSETPTLAVSSVTGEKGGEVAVQVTLNGGQIGGGGFDIRYNNSVLTLKSAAAGTFENVLVIVNRKYAENVARVSLAGSAALPAECVLLTLTFTVSATAQPGAYPVELENVRLYQASAADQNPVAVTPQLQNGGVTVPCVKLRVNTVEAAAMQSVKVQILLEEGLYPAGGGFTVTYDTAGLTAGEVARGSALPASSALVKNVDQSKGKIVISWAGDTSAQKGVLCTLTFAVSASASGELPISLSAVSMYDTTPSAMDWSVTNGAVKIVTASEKSPKLWVVGGLAEADGTATVGIVLEGRGSICGGEFTLRYDPEKCELLTRELPETLDAVAVVNSPLETSDNKTDAGIVKLAWAGATPSVKSQLLLVLKFRVTGSSALALEAAKTLDARGNAVARVDLRSGAIRTGDEELQTPLMSVDSVAGTSGKTAVTATVDVANAMQFTDQKPQNVRVFVSLYENGQMKTVEIEPEGITFDENGIASVAVDAACQGSATLMKVFFLQESTGAPCTESTSAALTE